MKALLLVALFLLTAVATASSEPCELGSSKKWTPARRRRCPSSVQIQPPQPENHPGVPSKNSSVVILLRFSERIRLFGRSWSDGSESSLGH